MGQRDTANSRFTAKGTARQPLRRAAHRVGPSGSAAGRFARPPSTAAGCTNLTNRAAGRRGLRRSRARLSQWATPQRRATLAIARSISRTSSASRTRGCLISAASTRPRTAAAPQESGPSGDAAAPLPNLRAWSRARNPWSSRKPRRRAEVGSGPETTSIKSQHWMSRYLSPVSAARGVGECQPGHVVGVRGSSQDWLHQVETGAQPAAAEDGLSPSFNPIPRSDCSDALILIAVAKDRWFASTDSDVESPPSNHVLLTGSYSLK